MAIPLEADPLSGRRTIINTRLVLIGICLALGLAVATTAAQAALLGLTQNEPVIDFGADGTIAHNFATGLVIISGRPNFLSELQTAPFLFSAIGDTSAGDSKLITAKFHVNAAGNFVSGVDGPDVVVRGSIDADYDGIPDYDGVLLEGEVGQFGYQDGGAIDDQFDLRIRVTGGALTMLTTTSQGISLSPLYGNSDLALQTVSEVNAGFPTSFTGSFASEFTGAASGSLGAIGNPRYVPEPNSLLLAGFALAALAVCRHLRHLPPNFKRMAVLRHS